MKEFKKFTLKTFQSAGYRLTPVEFKDVVPFEPKRVYYITHFEAAVHTGEHIHKVEEEVFIQVQGTSTAIIDRGNGKEDMPLVASDALYIPNFVWHGFKDPSFDCVILAITSTNYNPSREDYVEDYQEFLRLMNREE